MAAKTAKRRPAKKAAPSQASKAVERARRSARGAVGAATSGARGRGGDGPAPAPVKAAALPPPAAAERTTTPSSVPGPALALLEITEVPLGLRALDALVKEAPVTVLARGTVQCGRYLIAFAGEVEAVERSCARANAVALGAVADQVLLPDAEPRIVPAFRDAMLRPLVEGDALGMVESASCPVLLAVLDAALKGTAVDLVELRLADGLGGKALATLWGEIFDVEAALELCERARATHLERHGLRDPGLKTVVIPNADAETRSAVTRGTRFYGEWRG